MAGPGAGFGYNTSLVRKNLETDPAVIYVLDRELRIVYCNQAWDRFSADNGGLGLERRRQIGRPVMGVIPAPLKSFFEEGFGKALTFRQVWEHNYECSSPTVYRKFRMMVCPDPEGDGLVVVNSVFVERLHDSLERKAVPPDGLTYLDPHGFVTMCCHCRRTNRARQPAAWDWVPAHIESPPELVSHGICRVCANLYYPELRD